MLRTLRRVKQLTYLLFGSEFRDLKTLRTQVHRRYSSIPEVEYYQEIANQGFDFEEMATLQPFFNKTGSRDRVLVVGSGCGREAIAFANRGFRVTAIDLSHEMIEAANAIQHTTEKIQFICSSLENFVAVKTPLDKFDLVFVSSAIAEHICGKEFRIEFYKQASGLLSKNGLLFFYPNIKKLNMRSQYFWASCILRLRWSATALSWEEGDSARAFFGGHNHDFRPVYYHFYPNVEAFISEIGQAHLEIFGRVEEYENGPFLLKVNCE